MQEVVGEVGDGELCVRVVGGAVGDGAARWVPRGLRLGRPSWAAPPAKRFFFFVLFFFCFFYLQDICKSI